MNYGPRGRVSLGHTVGSSLLDPRGGQAQGLGMPRYLLAVGGFHDKGL